jgi:hypothetical protein
MLLQAQQQRLLLLLLLRLLLHVRIGTRHLRSHRRRPPAGCCCDSFVSKASNYGTGYLRATSVCGQTFLAPPSQQ